MQWPSFLQNLYLGFSSSELQVPILFSFLPTRMKAWRSLSEKYQTIINNNEHKNNPTLVWLKHVH
jgi:hypothetical protein